MLIKPGAFWCGHLVVSEQAVSDYDPCAGRLAAKTEAMATLRDVRRLALSANANSQWLAVGI